jgi:hypothetical protein
MGIGEGGRNSETTGRIRCAAVLQGGGGAVSDYDEKKSKNGGGIGSE